MTLVNLVTLAKPSFPLWRRIAQVSGLVLKTKPNQILYATIPDSHKPFGIIYIGSICELWAELEPWTDKHTDKHTDRIVYYRPGLASGLSLEKNAYAIL